MEGKRCWRGGIPQNELGNKATRSTHRSELTARLGALHPVSEDLHKTSFIQVVSRSYHFAQHSLSLRQGQYLRLAEKCLLQDDPSTVVSACIRSVSPSRYSCTAIFHSFLLRPRSSWVVSNGYMYSCAHSVSPSSHVLDTRYCVSCYVSSLIHISHTRPIKSSIQRLIDKISVDEYKAPNSHIVFSLFSLVHIA